MAARVKRIWPVLLTAAVALVYILMRLSAYGGDPVLLAEPGTRYAAQEADGTEGYDGQFTYYIALDPSPETIAEQLDVPAYRYQRILLPLFGWLLGGGNAARTAWALLIVNLLAHLAGTWSVGELLARHGWSRGYALIYGLWAGLVMSVGLDLHEPLAYGLAAVAILLYDCRQHIPAIFLAALAVMAKETTLFLWISFLLVECFGERSLKRLGVFLLTGAAYAGWQLWLYRQFGQIGLGSGGAYATPFEWVPLNGLWRIGAVSQRVLLLYLAVFGPTIVLPALWGLAASVGTLLEDAGRADAYFLAANTAVILFLPYSTFREPLGLIRFADGLVLAILYFAAYRGGPRVFRYGLLWIGMLAMLVNG